MPLKPKPALIATVAAYHNYVPGKHFRSKQRQQLLGSVSEGAMVDGVITAELRAGKQTHSFTVATLGPSRLGIVTARLLGDHLGPEVSREPSLSGFNAPWALIITTYHIRHYCVVRTAKKMGP